MTMNQNEIEKFFSDNPMPAAWFVAAKQGYIDVIHNIANNSMVEDVDMLCHLPSFDSYDHGSTALHLAIRAGHSDVVALLCKLGADPARTSNCSNYELNGLFQAIYRGHDTIVAQLLTQFPGLKNTRGFYDYTPLQAAVIFVYLAESTRVVSTLLNHGCSINEGLADGSVLLDHCLAGSITIPGQAQSDPQRLQLHESLIDLLCEWKANVDNVTQVVVTAASIGSLSIVKKLSTAGVNLNVKHVPFCTDDGPLTPILAAVLNGHEDIVRYLAQCPGVDLNCLTDNKRSVLHWAALKGYQSILQALWGLCSDIHNARERQKGMSVLHMAVYGNQVETVQWLLSCKEVDKHAVDGHGRDALQLAAYASMVESRCGHDVTLDIESYLRSTGLYKSQDRGKYHQTADDMNPQGRQVSHVSRHTVFHTWGNGVSQQLEPVKTDQCTDSDASDKSKAVQIVSHNDRPEKRGEGMQQSAPTNKQPAHVNQRSISEDDSQYNTWIKAIRYALSGGSIVVGQDVLTFDDGQYRIPLPLTKEVLSCLPSSTVYHLASLADERDQPRLLECCIDALQAYTTQEFYALNPMTLNAIARLACKGYPRTLNSITKHLVDVPLEVCHSATLATIARASLERHSTVLPMLINSVNKISLDTFLCLDPATVYHLARAALVGFPDVLEALSPLLARLTPVQKALLHEGTGQKLQAVADDGHQQAYKAFFAEADTNKDHPSSSVSYPLAQQLTEALAAADKKNFAPLEACVPCLERLSVLELRQCPVNLVSSLASLSYYSKIHAPLNALARVCGLMQVDVLLDLHAHTFFNVIACAEQGQTRVFDAMAPLLRHVPVTMYTRLDPKMFSNVVAYQMKVYEETQKNNALFPVEEWQFLTKPVVLHANPDVLKNVVWFARTTGLISPAIVTKTVLFELPLQEFLQLSPCTLQELQCLEDEHVTKRLAHLLSAMTVQEFCRLAPDTLVAILEGCCENPLLLDALRPIIKRLTKEQLDNLAPRIQELLQKEPSLRVLTELSFSARVKDPVISPQHPAIKPAVALSPAPRVEPMQKGGLNMNTGISSPPHSSASFYKAPSFGSTQAVFKSESGPLRSSPPSFGRTGQAYENTQTSKPAPTNNPFRRNSSPNHSIFGGTFSRFSHGAPYGLERNTVRPKVALGRDLHRKPTVEEPKVKPKGPSLRMGGLSL